MIYALTTGMKSWIKQCFQDICESPTEYGITDLKVAFDKIVDLIEEDVNTKFEVQIPRSLIVEFLQNE